MALGNIALTQLLMKPGLRKYKCEGRAAVKKEFLQLRIREAFGTLRAEDMTEGKKLCARNDDVLKGKVLRHNQGAEMCRRVQET